MKKLLTLILFAALCYSVQGQIIRAMPFARAQVATGTYYSEYQTIYNALSNKPTSGTATAQNAMVYSLDSAGFWDRMDLMYVFATDAGETESKVNWINTSTFTASEVGAGNLTWTSLEGFTGDGTSALNTGYNMSTESTNYTLDDCSWMVYIRNDIDENNNYILGATDGTNITHFSINTGDAAFLRLNSTGSLQWAGITNHSGFFTFTRRADNDLEGYRNGTSGVTGTTASSSLPNADLYILNRIDDQYSAATNQVSIVIVMDGVDDTEADAIYDIIQRYMTAIGKQV